MRRRWKVLGLTAAGGSALLFCLFLLCAGLDAVLQIPVTLALGWPKYLWRVIPQLRPDPWMVGTAIACLAGVILGTHAFCRWLAPPWPWKRTWRVVGLVVLMFVAGISVVGIVHQTAWLVHSPEPLLRYYSSLQTLSANNLKQIGIGAGSHQNAFATLPCAQFDTNGRAMHSWQTTLLPYLEQYGLYNQIDFTKPWTDPINAQPMRERVKVFLNYPFNDEKVNGYGVSHYAGNVYVVMGDTPRTFQSFPAGVSNTILAGEVSSNFRAWGDPLNARDPRLGGNGHPHGFGGPNDRPAQLVMLDGSVRTFDPQLAELMSKPPE